MALLWSPRISIHLALEYALRISPKVRIGSVIIPVLPIDQIIASKTEQIHV